MSVKPYLYCEDLSQEMELNQLRPENPELGDRAYRVIELPNKLEALLVHDPDTHRSSASLNVNIGNFADDEDMPGMAHAVENLLFMGTKKYPVENEYSSYLSANSGYSNAYVTATQTNYFFECAALNKSNHKGGPTNGTREIGGAATYETIRGPLYGALRRFSQFFIEPLFLEDTLGGNQRVINSENKKNLLSLQTLRGEPDEGGIKSRAAFSQFYETHYSANRMKLVVLGREPLEELEAWVSESFSEVNNKDLPEMQWDDTPVKVSARRGRGKRKNCVYWNSKRGDSDTNPFERDCLFGTVEGRLVVPATSYMDSSSAVPRCMSRKYLEQLGLESELSTDFDDPGLISTGIEGQQAKVTGIVRDVSFRIKGSSGAFKGDFYVSESLDSFYDVLFGWQFMCNEAANILEKAHQIYREAKALVGKEASEFSARIRKVASEVQTRASDFFGGISSPPPPPYSLVNVLEGDFLVTPRLI